MTNTVQEIEALTGSMFDAELGDEIIQSLKKDQMEAEAEMGEMGAEGVATFFAGDRLYNRTGVGLFEGLPHIIWNGLFDNEKTPRFLYQPNADNPFRFVTSTGRMIQPGLMDTDGGSIPRILHGIAKFSPWGYALGYIIHDWIFVAHKCGHQPDDGLTFEDSAVILAECIKTMMEVGFTDFDGGTKKFTKKEDTMYLIYKAVSSSIAENLWNDTSSTVCR